ncbi:hypothetical protein KEH51_09810 [[Brevibacterium] frigoritolerans]|uniref:Uncharacterized protein n=1 Tax=Peribacillus frigoritolerans TaxID=450367 RepID=A0A941FKX3_9BACI|nr:hypothetical protein [Peribacillus frigoritolerans]
MNTFLYRKKPYWIEEICHTPAEVLAMMRHERQSAKGSEFLESTGTFIN